MKITQETINELTDIELFDLMLKIDLSDRLFIPIFYRKEELIIMGTKHTIETARNKLMKDDFTSDILHQFFRIYLEVDETDYERDCYDILIDELIN